VKRLFRSHEMNQVADATFARPDIQRAVCEDSEMVDGGYLAELDSKQMAWLATRFLPTGRGPDEELAG
jgi:hypothetical protein